MKAHMTTCPIVTPSVKHRFLPSDKQQENKEVQEDLVFFLVSPFAFLVLLFVADAFPLGFPTLWSLGLFILYRRIFYLVIFFILCSVRFFIVVHYTPFEGAFSAAELPGGWVLGGVVFCRTNANGGIYLITEGVWFDISEDLLWGVLSTLLLSFRLEPHPSFALLHGPPSRLVPSPPSFFPGCCISQEAQADEEETQYVHSHSDCGVG